jgi:hypothetical protein
MPHFLQVKKEFASQFNGIFPYNPFNRIVYTPIGLYLESGFLDLVIRGFYRPITYTPAIIDINLAVTPMVGFLFFNFTIINASVVGLDNLCKFNEIQTIRATAIGGVRESKALNCEQKTDELIMIDPRGEGKECSSHYVPRIPNLPPVGLLGSLAGQMTYIEVQAINATSATVPYDGVRETCVDRNAVELEFKGETKIYCPNDILTKKFCQQKFPPSLFTGKLKLYIQSIYGGNYVEYRNETGSYIENLYVGPGFGQPSTLASRTALFGRGSHFLHTDSLGNYYLINTSSWSVNPIVPNNYGRLLQRYIKKTNPTGLNKDTLEGYVLASCTPTTSIAHVKGVPGYGTYGSPLDFGWKANWEGTTLATVALKSNEANYRISTLLGMSVSSSGISQLYEEEIERKKADLRLQRSRKKVGYVQTAGLFKVYTCKAVLKVKEVEGEPDIECFDGDIEDGLWSYVVLGFTADQAAEEEAAKEEAKKKNKVYGGLPYSEEFYAELPNYFEITQSDCTSSDPWIEPLQSDKIFTWDSYTNDYAWRLACNPREFGMVCPGQVLGTFPVYCWFDRKDNLQVVSYTNRAVGAGDNNIIPPEGICGTGSDSYLTEIFNGGNVSGFQLDTISATSMNGTNHSTEEGEMTVTAGQWSNCWGGACGPSPGCDNDGAEPGTGIYGCLATFWTSWKQDRSGSAEANEKKSGGSINHFTYLVIPEKDAECIFFGNQTTKTKTGSKTKSLAENNLVTAKRESGVSAFWKTRKSIHQAQGWFVCAAVWFCHTWGKAVGCPESPPTPEHFSCCWCQFWPGDPPMDTPSRPWGPAGPDTPVVESNVVPYGGYTSVVTESFFEGTVEFKGYYVGKDGKKLTLLEKERTTDNEGDLYIPGLGNYACFVDWIDLRWPYANSGPVFGSIQSVQNLKILYSPSGDFKDPKQFPYKKGHSFPVGYV